MNLKDHIKVSEDLRLAIYYLNKVRDKCSGDFNKSSRIMKRLHEITGHNGKIKDVQCDLDTDYLKIISDCEFNKLGYIYYKYKGKNKDELRISTHDRPNTIRER